MRSALCRSALQPSVCKLQLLRAPGLARRRRLRALAARVGLAALAALGALGLGLLRARRLRASPSSPSALALPRRRSAAARSRPPTPLACGLAAFGSSRSRRWDRTRCRPARSARLPRCRRGGSRGAGCGCSRPAAPRSAARSCRTACRRRRGSGCRAAPAGARAATPPVGVARGEAALGDGDDPLDEGPQLLRLRHRRLDLLVLDQRFRLVAEHRDPVLGDSAQFRCLLCDACSILSARIQARMAEL